MIKSTTPLLVILLIIVVGVANAESIVVIDDSGTTLTLSEPAKRVVGLSPHIVENLFAAGAGETLVGAVAYADFPEAAKTLPALGSFAFINMEALVALQPDLVIAWGSGNGDKTITQIRELGLTVYVDEPKQLRDIAHSLVQFGLLTGHVPSAEQAAQQFLTELNSLQETYKNSPPLSVLYQIWHSPIQTINDQHTISSVIKLCGGRNAFADALPVAPVVNRETVLARNPDVIIASGADDNRPVWLDNWKEWPSLKAVQQQALFFIPPDYLQRHTPRILIGAQQMCEQLQGVRELHQ